MMFETYMVHKYVKGMLIGKSYYQGTTMKTLTYYMAKAYRDGEVRFGKTVHFDEARVYKYVDGKEEFLQTFTKFKSLPMA
jgi:hypothetical protein